MTISPLKGFQLITKAVRVSIHGVCLLAIAPVVQTQAAAEKKFARDDRIGICTHFAQNWPVEVLMPMIARSGAGWIRDDFGWAGMEPTPGNYQIPAKAKNWIQAARRAGLKIDLILSYGNPAYADRYDPVAYAKAAGWLARELANDVQAIEILNEPNNFGFRDLYGGQWNGNEPHGAVSPYVQKYVELLNAAAKEIKLANPHMTVIGLGAPAPASFRMIALGLAPEVDGLTDHPYAGKLPETVQYAGTPFFLQRDGIATADANGTLVSQVAMFRAQAKKWNATEKLWHTEWGFATVSANPEKHKPAVSEETQAIYTLRRILESEAIGVEHTFIYDFKDDGTNPLSDYDNFGLVKIGRVPKLAYFALQRVTSVLAGTEVAPADQQASIESDAAQEKDSLGHRCYTYSSSHEPKTLVAFWEAKPWDSNAAATPAVVSLPPGPENRHAFLYNFLSGEETELPGKRSEDHRLRVAVSLSAAPQLLIIR
jgi:hypothetical protein